MMGWCDMVLRNEREDGLEKVLVWRRRMQEGISAGYDQISRCSGRLDR